MIILSRRLLLQMTSPKRPKPALLSLLAGPVLFVLVGYGDGVEGGDDGADVTGML